MNKFMLIFHGDAAATSIQPSPEEMQAEMQKWNTWIAGIAAQGKFISTDGLMPFGKIVRGPQAVVTDGPFTEGKEIIGGYAVVSASTLDEAIALADGCPTLTYHGAVEVRPIIDFQQVS